MFSREKRNRDPKPPRRRRPRGSCPTYSSETTGPRGSDLDRRAARPQHPGRVLSRVPKPVPDDDKDECPVVERQEVNKHLHVEKVDLHIQDNVVKHHTDQYECTEDHISEKTDKMKEAQLVIRRGDTFKMTIHFDRAYDIVKNDITLQFRLGEDYTPCRRLNASFKVVEKKIEIPKSSKKWGACVTGQDGNSLTLDVYVPYGVPVGEWEFSVRTVVDKVGGRDIRWQYNHTKEGIKILFNPWCKEDAVYMEDEKWREETVLNEAGAVYTGSYKKIAAKPWFFGQFEDDVLDIGLHLLRKGFGSTKPSMGSPAAVARVISTIVNSQDDEGVLFGNWSGNYAGGTKPTSWNGSVKILERYMDKGLPVKFGQCWVFSAVTTTVCRAIGLPCRSVTNHSSAHNTDLERISIDVFRKKNSEGKWVEEKRDSIWNFHVWNECWFRCPNLNTDETKYDGWNVIDATPQEHSDGVYCCGPAPVIAVKQGHIGVGYDTAFVFAEVNADKVEWKENPDTGRLTETKRLRNAVGKCISTHKPTGEPYTSSTMGSFFRFFTGGDDMEREDLTDLYKFPEGSEEERDIYRKTSRKFRQMCGCDDDEEGDNECEEEEPVDIEIEEEEEEVYVGNDFGFIIKVKNRGKETRTMTLEAQVKYKTYYDTVLTDVAAEEKFKDIKLSPGETEKFKIKVTKEKAICKPQYGFNFEAKAVAEFKENDHMVTGDLDFRLRRPDLEVKGPKSCKKDETIKVEVSFKNPLHVPLTRCEVNLEGPFKYLRWTKQDFTIDDIAPGATWRTTLELQAKKPNQKPKVRCLNIGLDSRELEDISGSYTVKLEQ